MIKNTPKEHSDLINLNRAIERMQNGVATINECARKLNGMKPIIDVQNRFSEVMVFLIRKLTLRIPTDF